MTWTARALKHARDLRKTRDDIVSGQAIESGFVAIERCGAWLCGRPQATLGESRHNIVALIADLHHGGGPTHGRLARTVLEARNLRMHTGAVTEQGVRCTLMLMERLEEALMKRAGGMDGLTADDVMARPVATAEPCDTLYDVRVTMLGHGYSALPVRAAGQWRWITDKWLMEAIRAHRIEAKLSAVTGNPIESLDPATPIDRAQRIAEVKTPALVVEGEEEKAIGVVTAFDILLLV